MKCWGSSCWSTCAVGGRRGCHPILPCIPATSHNAATLHGRRTEITKPVNQHTCSTCFMSVIVFQGGGARRGFCVAKPASSWEPIAHGESLMPGAAAQSISFTSAPTGISVMGPTVLDFATPLNPSPAAISRRNVT